MQVTGLYFLESDATSRAREVQPSDRGELEITTLLETYLHEGRLIVERMGRGFAWLDTGTHSSLLDASNFVRTLEIRQGMQSGSLEEAAYQQGWISAAELRTQAQRFVKTDYGRYLAALIDEKSKLHRCRDKPQI